jgi:hypothetical protein
VKTSYLQKISGTWRVRIVVPSLLVPIIGKANLTRPLGTPNKRKAKERAAPIIAKLLAEITGPPIEDDDIEALADGWWRLFQLDRSRLIMNPQGLPCWPNGRQRLDDINPKSWALTSDDDLSRSVRWFISGPRQWRDPLAPDANRDKVESFLGDPKRSAQLLLNIDAMGRLLRNCKLTHDEAARRDVGQEDSEKLDGSNKGPKEVLVKSWRRLIARSGT